jgi:mannose-6-phosphate isomerase
MKYYNNYLTEERPWGKFEILVDNDNCKVKRITVYPNGRLSYQYHHKRSEVWTIVSGIATMTLDDKISDYIYGETILIPQGTKHRVENKGFDDLVFIEVQHGSYFGEDDIVRIEDDYNRE